MLPGLLNSSVSIISDDFESGLLFNDCLEKNKNLKSFPKWILWPKALVRTTWKSLLDLPNQACVLYSSGKAFLASSIFVSNLFLVGAQNCFTFIFREKISVYEVVKNLLAVKV